jgi:hypothetical protein
MRALQLLRLSERHRARALGLAPEMDDEAEQCS